MSDAVEDRDKHLIHDPPCCWGGETEVSRFVAVYDLGEPHCPVCLAMLKRPMKEAERA